MKTATWRHADVFPIIEHIIKQHEGKWLLSYEIGDLLLDDTEARPLIDAAATAQSNPPEWVACNMVAWYSKRVVERTWRCSFEQKRVGRMARFNGAPQYAYKAVRE